MLRLFIAFHLLFLNLYACKGDYASCVQKAKDAKVIKKSSLYIPVKHNKLLVYSRTIPNEKILKHDPFLSLYLIEDKKPFAYPYTINMKLQLGTAILNTRKAKEGKFVHNQIGLNSFAKYNQTLGIPALLSSSCCSLEGLVTSRGVIQKEYLQHFLRAKKVSYGDIGIRVNNDKSFVIVKASDPFMKNNPFKVGDCIVAFDNTKVKSASVLMQKILFSVIGSKHNVKVKRGSKFLNFRVLTNKRYGGGYLSDTFLEQKGIYFDESLKITNITKKFKDYGLDVGDKLIGVNGVLVNNQDELRHYIENFKDYSSLLFERNKFQFFVNLK